MTHFAIQYRFPENETWYTGVLRYPTAEAAFNDVQFYKGTPVEICRVVNLNEVKQDLKSNNSDDLQ